MQIRFSNAIKATRQLMSGLAVLLCTWAPAGASDERALVLESGSGQVRLLELYTSEGCNSCPPADRWLRALKEEPKLWERLVPVAFHVDYWDYIGWQDRFARPEFSARQRSHAAVSGQRTVYTPGFVLNGEEWRGWRRREGLQMLTAPPQEEPGQLSVVFGDGVAKVTYDPVQGGAALAANIAVLGFDLTTEVRAGENRGRKLQHDFVVLSLNSGTLVARDGLYQGVVDVPVHRVGARRLAVAAWVSHASHPAPLQAVGGWLPSRMIISSHNVD